MGFSIRGAIRGVARGARALTKIPGVGMIPGVGNVLSAVGTGLSLYGAVKGAQSLLGGGGDSSPAFGMGIPPGAQPLRGTMSGPGTGMAYPNMGKRSIFRDDPNVSEQLKPYAIDDRFLKTYHRGPRGTVVLHDNAGDAFAIPKEIAIAHHLWKPGKKPPISVGDWSKLMGANRVVKKFREIEKKAMKIANFHAPRRARPLAIASMPGKSVIIRK